MAATINRAPVSTPFVPAADTGEVRAPAMIVKGRPASDGAGVKLNRVIGGAALPDLDPFLMLDEFRSDKGADYIAGFPDHPHRGFETVTYMLAGRMRHGDNQGNTGLLRPGSVQWMTAGRGIVHSEMPEQQEGRMRGFQLWINLPARDKMTEPKYQEFAPEKIAVATPAEGVRIKVIAGQVGDVAGPIQQPATQPTYLDIELRSGARFTHALPADHSAFLYVYEGTMGVGDAASAKNIGSHELAVLSGGTEVNLEARAEGQTVSRAILVAGRPLREPVAKYGPFVMNTQAEIIRAIEDFQSGRF